MTAQSLIARLNGGQGDDTVIALGCDGPISLGQLRRDAQAFAARLRQQNIDRLGLWCTDGYCLTAALVGAAEAGCSLVFPQSLQADVIQDLSSSWDVLAMDTDIAHAPNTEAAPFTFASDQVYLRFFTSGTTASPKSITRTLGQLEQEAQALESLWGQRARGAHLATTPHQHIYGLVFKIMWPLCAGRAFHSHSRDMWEDVLATLQDDDVLITSPAHLKRLGGIDSAPKPALIISAGAPLPDDAAAQAGQLFATIPVEIYGSTETGIVAHRDRAALSPVWHPVPGAIIDSAEAGTIRITAPWISAPHHGADMIKPDGNGFHLLGRADRIVKIEGKRVGLAAVEAALMELPDISDCAVICQNGRRDSVAAAIVLTAQGRDQLQKLGPFRLGRHLRAALAQRLDPMARPRNWRFVESLPIDGLGKRRTADILSLFTPQAPHD